MFLTAFEQLASRFGSLRAIFELVEATVSKAPKSLLDAYTLASHLNVSEDSVSAAMDQAVAADLLVKLTGGICQICGAWSRIEEWKHLARCTGCDAPLPQPPSQLGTRYRLSPAGKAAQQAATAGIGTSSWPSDEASAYRGNIRAAIITVKAEEEDAILTHFPSHHTVEGARSYNLSRATNVFGDVFLVATVRQPKQGNLHAASVVTDLIADFDPVWLILVGIAGASPFGDAVLGDVVFGTHVHDLTVRVDEADGTQKYSASGGAVVKDVETQVVHLRSQLQAEVAVPVGRPALNLNKLQFTTKNKEVNAKIRARVKARFDENGLGTTRVLDGPVLSSDSLMKDPNILIQWYSTMRSALTVEMESAGAHHAARAKGKTYALLPIRAISDIVGLKKQEDWVVHACQVAAAFAHAFVIRFKP